MRAKILPVLLSAFFVVFGFILGVGLTKLNTSPSPIAQTSQPKQEVKKQQTQPQKETYKTYTVLPGDTLLGISVKLEVPMDELAKLNGITDANQIKAGQVLKIPISGTTAQTGQIQIDLAKMKEIQDLVNQGNQPWRLDPVEVVKADAPASFEFTALDTYSLKSKDDVKGEAVVEVKKEKDSKSYTYEVSLIQPVDKGPKGIWAITAIKETQG